MHCMHKGVGLSMCVNRQDMTPHTVCLITAHSIVWLAIHPLPRNAHICYSSTHSYRGPRASTLLAHACMHLCRHVCGHASTIPPILTRKCQLCDSTSYFPSYSVLVCTLQTLTHTCINIHSHLPPPWLQGDRGSVRSLTTFCLRSIN